MGDIQRIFYVHLPLAWVGFVAFGHAAWAGVQYLRTGRREWDIASASAAEIGVLFATLVIITGSLWARPVWGTWWTWDPQLVTYLILWLIYVGYLVLRAAAGDDPRQARFAAVFAIVGFVDVPLVWLSARYLRALSPVIFTMHSVGLAPSMVWALRGRVGRLEPRCTCCSFARGSASACSTPASRRCPMRAPRP